MKKPSALEKLISLKDTGASQVVLVLDEIYQSYYGLYQAILRNALELENEVLMICAESSPVLFESYSSRVKAITCRSFDRALDIIASRKASVVIIDNLEYLLVKSQVDFVNSFQLMCGISHQIIAGVHSDTCDLWKLDTAVELSSTVVRVKHLQRFINMQPDLQFLKFQNKTDYDSSLVNTDNQSKSFLVEYESKKSDAKYVKEATILDLSTSAPRFTSLKAFLAQDSKDAETVSPQTQVEALATFSVSLTSEQELSRSKVALPYMRAQNAKTKQAMQITYVPDEADDFDDEDPDADLEI
jgi:hypothetical protein